MHQRKKVIRIGATVIISVAALTAAFLFINTFWGNPVSAAITDSKLNAYLGETYTSQCLVDEKKISYDFLNRTYGKTVKAPGSTDVFFSVRYYEGHISDDYEGSVLSWSNTLSRLPREYYALASSLLKQSGGDEISDVSVLYSPKEGQET